MSRENKSAEVSPKWIIYIYIYILIKTLLIDFLLSFFFRAYQHSWVI